MFTKFTDASDAIATPSQTLPPYLHEKPKHDD
jgi:hypothetical protein